MTVVFVFSSLFLWTMSEWITHVAVVFCLMTAVSLFVLRKRRGWCRMFFIFKHHFSILFPLCSNPNLLFWVFFVVVEIPQIPRWSGRSGSWSGRTGRTDRDGSGGSRAQGKRCELMWCEVMNWSPIFGGASNLMQDANVWWILRDFPISIVHCLGWLVI